MASDNYNDIDPQETAEWLAALDAVVQTGGSERAHFLIEQLIEKARLKGVTLPYSATTPYVRTRCRWRSRRAFRVTRRWSTASARTRAGTPWR
ncbi:hypothetical protein EV699_109186, partial [Plasticicumulans lactativorans]